MSEKGQLWYRYKFVFKNGVERDFELKIDEKTLNAIEPPRKESFPKWTELKSFKCPNCTLDAKTRTHCPIALNLIDLVDAFTSLFSYEEVNVIVDSDTRQFSKKTSLQKGISSLMGMYMVVSGCPVMEKLKPMVRYHLPFATMEETGYRLISMYLIAQYFVYRSGKQADWNMDKLARIYDDVQVINRNICNKLGELKIEDALLNALVSLDCFASSISLASYRTIIEKLEHVYKPFL